MASLGNLVAYADTFAAISPNPPSNHCTREERQLSDIQCEPSGSRQPGEAAVLNPVWFLERISRRFPERAHNVPRQRAGPDNYPYVRQMKPQRSDTYPRATPGRETAARGVCVQVDALTRALLAAFPPWRKTHTECESALAHRRYRCYRISIKHHQWSIEYDNVERMSCDSSV